jgi:hypothetical protein
MNNDVGPLPVSPMILLLRALGGIGGGVVGTAVVILISILGAGILQSALGAGSEDGTVHPLFVFVFIAMMFLGSLASNLLGPLFLGLSDRKKYVALTTSLYQIFIANIVILIVLVPVYMLISGLKVEMLSSVAALQVVVSAFVSALILEIIADHKYALLGVYSTAFSVLVSAGIYFFFYSVSSDQPIILLFLALPVIWGAIGIFSGLMGLVYEKIYRLYGIDFLSSEVKYGDDENYGVEPTEEDEEEEENKPKNESGADFLGKN